MTIAAMISKEKVKLELSTLTSNFFHAYLVSISLLHYSHKVRCITQRAKMSIDPKFIELTADVFRFIFSK